jgi:hypothetical protein
MSDAKKDSGWRRIVLSLFIPVYLITYIVLVLWLWERLPHRHKLLDVLYFMFFGMGWGLPLLPVMKWALKPRS